MRSAGWKTPMLSELATEFSPGQWAARGRHHTWPLAMLCSCRAVLSGCCTLCDARAGGQVFSPSPCFCTFSIVQSAAKLSLLLGLALSLAPPSDVVAGVSFLFSFTLVVPQATRGMLGLASCAFVFLCPSLRVNRAYGPGLNCARSP